MHGLPKRICVIGAECTGKTTLAQHLAAHLGGVVVPEVLRHWCDTHGRTPQAAEQAGLLQAQIFEENKALAHANQAKLAMVFCDTAPVLTAVYSQHYFADPSLLACALAHHRVYDLTLWLQPDLPWVADGMQRDGLVAQTAVHRLLGLALNGPWPVVCITGQGDVRLQAALRAVSMFDFAALQHRENPDV